MAARCAGFGALSGAASRAVRAAHRPAHARGAAAARPECGRRTSPSTPTIVPVSLFWGRAPGRERSWLRLMVAEGWDIGGRFRKVALAADQRAQPARAVRRTRSRCSPRSPRRAGCHADRAACGGSLRVQLRNQRAATIGPDLSHRRTIVAQVLRTQAVRQAVREEMRTKGLERREALDRARSTRKEIAANYSHPVRRLHVGRARAGSGTGSTTASRSRTSRASRPSTRAARSSTCRATAATWTTCCSRTSCFTRALRCRTSRRAST